MSCDFECFPSSDILVTSSGRAEPEELGKSTEENFDATFELNARATLFTVQKALPLIRDGGSVILVGSIAGYVGVPGYTTSNAKAALLVEDRREQPVQIGAAGDITGDGA
jgi:NAD(P)-dependent dehydrogenase (short-subunit alcohol dehydrogenase family)